jgi:DNA-binding transcriptional ArsR family regulator
MPSRYLRDGILTSGKVCRLGWAEEVFYRRLMSVVDDYGLYYADHGLLRAACYPRQLNKVSDSNIGKWLTVLVEAALVSLYRAEDRER